MAKSAQKPNQYLIGGAFLRDKIRALRRAWQIASERYPTFWEAFLSFICMMRAAVENNRIRHIVKGVKVGDRVYTLMGMPGRPSKAMDNIILNELHRCRPISNHTAGPMLLLFAITKKCSLRCEHCFEWDALNHKETLSLDNILAIVRKFQAHGVSQIELSGGEPLHRFGDVLEILHQSDTESTDFWLLTSGYHLTAEKAQQLKSAGLRGISVSLDHWSAPDHDRFRGMEGSYDWAIQAAQNARNAELVVSLSLVTTREFCTFENLWRYADLARELQVHFIRLVEPRAVGHYAGLPVELTDAELDVLENFVRAIQRAPAYNDYPLVEYHATYQRTVGCGGGGKRYLYIDTDGDIHACPFCRHKCGSAISTTFEEDRLALKQRGGCPTFHPK